MFSMDTIRSTAGQISARLRIAVLSMAAVTFGLAACGGGGGGGDDETTDFPAQGVYFGQTGSGRAMLGMVRDDGAFWILYTDTSNTYLAGAVQGTASAEDGRFSSSNAKDFNADEGAIYDVTIDASYVEARSISGTATYEFGYNTFDMEYQDDYESTPRLSELAGYYEGETLTSQGSGMAYAYIEASGEISGGDGYSCTFSGMASPDEHGNLFNLSVTFDGGGCALGTQSVRGIAYFSGAALYAVAVNGDRNDGFIFAGY